MDFVDQATALLTLNDGRELVVIMSGSPSISTQGRAVISIQIDDPAVAGMNPEELRSRLRLLRSGVCWQSHWDDDELRTQAALNARKQAVHVLDEAVDAMALQEIPEHLRRQTLLHWAVVDILSQTHQLRVPPVVARGALGVETLLAGQVLKITHAAVEPRLGDMVPDVVVRCATSGGEDLGDVLLEVVVTHAVDAIKTGKILRANLPALEIDLRRYAGTLDRAGLSTLVVHALEGKRWVHYPGMVARTEALQVDRERPKASGIGARHSAPTSAQQILHGGTLVEQAGRFAWTEPGTENLTSRAVEVFRRINHDGAFRHSAPRVDYDRIFSEAVLARGQSKSLEEVLTLWTTTYRCETNVEAITGLLVAARLIRRRS